MSAAAKQEVSQLNEYAQKWGTSKKQAEYEFVDRMLQNKKEFTAKCKFEGNVTVGSGFSKMEAKRISAGHMLALLHEKDPLKFTATPKITPKKAEEEPVTSNKLEDFDSAKLDIYLDKYLDTREKDYSKFRRLFVGDMPENTEEQFQVNDEIVDAKSAKSKTLERLKITGISVVNTENAYRLFKAIVQEMNLSYYAEFLETSNNDRYAVLIKINVNLFTAGGIGGTPEEAIQASCKNAIEFLFIFNS